MSFTIALVSLLLAAYIVKRLCYHRFEQFAKWPQLKPSILWGHLGHIQEAVSSGPSDRHIDYVFQEISEKLGKPPAFVLDLRPVAAPLCVISSHTLAEQVSKRSKKFPYSLPKTAMDSSYTALLGHRSLLTLQGEEWRKMRQRLNPAFSKGYLISQIPGFLENVYPFLECLDEYSRHDTDFPLQEPLADLTLGIMSSALMGGINNNPSEMSQQNLIVSSFRELYSTYSFDASSPSWFTNPRLKWRRSRVEKKLNNLLQDTIKKASENKSHGLDNEPFTTHATAQNVIALALNDMDHITTDMLDLVCDQLKLLLFAGFDTTIHLLAWLFYQLSITPRALEAVRGELDAILGPEMDPDLTKQRFLSNPADILRRMPYASALIKETLRVQPPGATSRTLPVGSGAFLRMPDGRELCLDGLSVYSCHSMIHRDEDVWGNTKDAFIPERWLSPKDAMPQSNPEKDIQADGSSAASVRPPPGAWRPFERGPRDCLGQELALLITKIVLIFAARRYDFSKTGLGQVARNTNNEPILNTSGQYEVLSPLYNSRQLVPKPVDRMRMRVKFNPKVLANSPR